MTLSLNELLQKCPEVILKVGIKDNQGNLVDGYELNDILLKLSPEEDYIPSMGVVIDLVSERLEDTSPKKDPRRNMQVMLCVFIGVFIGRVIEFGEYDDDDKNMLKHFNRVISFLSHTNKHREICLTQKVLHSMRELQMLMTGEEEDLESFLEAYGILTPDDDVEECDVHGSPRQSDLKRKPSKSGGGLSSTKRAKTKAT